MWLLVDHSNRFTKFALGDMLGLKPLACRAPSGSWETVGPPTGLVAELAASGITPGRLLFCGVRKDDAAAIAALLPLLDSDAPEPFILRAETSGLDFQNHPDPPKIGADRLANAIAAAALVPPGHVAIVVDAGTAVTIDAVLAGARPAFLGGAIAPGPATQARALHDQTALLPEIGPPFSHDTPALGQATADAIRAALVHGFPAMVAGIVDAQRRELADSGHPSPVVVVTGGDAEMLAAPPWFADATRSPNLTLDGLRLAWFAWLRAQDA